MNDKEFMRALAEARRRPQFAAATGGMSAERIRIIWETLTSEMERGGK